MLIGVDRTRNNGILKVTKVCNGGTKKPAKNKNASEEEKKEEAGCNVTNDLIPYGTGHK